MSTGVCVGVSILQVRWDLRNVSHLTLHPLELCASERHGQIQGDVVFVVTHTHHEVKFHLRQNL